MKSNPLYENLFSLLLLLVALMGIYSCATESHRIVASEKVESYTTTYNGPRTTMVVGNFQNRYSYMQGLFLLDHITHRCAGSTASKIVKARSLLCYWPPSDLGITQAWLSKWLRLSQPAISLSVARGHAIAIQNKYRIENL